MTKLLNILDAKYRSWLTIKRNMIKYAELQAVKYITCDGHELLTTKPAGNADDCETNNVQDCSVCRGRSSVQGSRGTFEYIPILFRLRKWVQSTRTMHHPYDYW